ncbi:MAG: sigma-70 family RNA polymerase sigma factor [Tannerellaceae bacterium]|jgi:RNA polymerase sigma-70 factor (ECF subfamily)|nr:sigma-70 family RNA polymerase sigma factor [Tannerellaceae bacterium]
MLSNKGTDSLNETLQLLKEGSYQAFDQVYREYFDLLYGFILKLTHSHDRTKEIVQETFIKVWLNKEKVNPDLPFKAWLFKIAQNMVVDEMRKQFSDSVFENYLDHLTNEKLTVSIQDTFDFDLFRKALSDAKKLLSPRQLQVFELCRETGIPPNEVAAKLHLSKQTVYNYLNQALCILRKEMSSFVILFSLFFS